MPEASLNPALVKTHRGGYQRRACLDPEKRRMDICRGDRFPGVGGCHHRQVAGAGGSGRGLNLLLVRGEGHHWRHGYRYRHPLSCT